MKKLALSFILILLSINFVEAKKSAIDFQVTKQLIDTVKWEIINESSVRFMIEEIPSLYDTDIKCIRITIGDEVCAESHVYLNEEDKEIPLLCVTGQINKYRNKDVFVSFLNFFQKNSIVYYQLSKYEENSKPDWRLQLTKSQMFEVLAFLRELNDYNHAQSEASRTTFESDTLNLSLLLDKILQRYNPSDKYKTVLKQVVNDGIRIYYQTKEKSSFYLFGHENTDRFNIEYSGKKLSYFSIKKDGNKIFSYQYGFNLGHIKYDFIGKLYVERLLEDLESLGYILYSQKKEQRESPFGMNYHTSSINQYIYLIKNNDIIQVKMEHSYEHDYDYFNCNVFIDIFPNCMNKNKRDDILKNSILY